MINIDHSKKISSKNYYKARYDKKQIILAGSLRKNNYHIKRLEKKEYGSTKTWCTFSISREGKIYQHYNPVHYTDFMGDKSIDKGSISIVLENMGILTYDYDNNVYVNWVNEICPEEKVFDKKWNGFTYWESYTKEQHKSTLELCRYLCDKYNINKNSLGFNVYYDDTENYEGIVTRSNFDMDYHDLNPSFNFKWFEEELESTL